MYLSFHILFACKGTVNRRQYKTNGFVFISHNNPTPYYIYAHAKTLWAHKTNEQHMKEKNKKALKEVKNEEVTDVNIYYHFA